MKVVRLSAEENFLEVDSEPYFLFTTPARTDHIVPGRCPHRGGPLHLGAVDVERGCIVCPWHGRRTSFDSLVRRALPSMPSSDGMSVVTAAEAVHVLRRTTLVSSPAAPRLPVPERTAPCD